MFKHLQLCTKILDFAKATRSLAMQTMVTNLGPTWPTKSSLSVAEFWFEISSQSFGHERNPGCPKLSLVLNCALRCSDPLGKRHLPLRSNTGSASLGEFLFVFPVHLVLCLDVVNHRYSFALFFLSAKAIKAATAKARKGLPMREVWSFFSPSIEVKKSTVEKKQIVPY